MLAVTFSLECERATKWAVHVWVMLNTWRISSDFPARHWVSVCPHSVKQAN